MTYTLPKTSKPPRKLEAVKEFRNGRWEVVGHVVTVKELKEGIVVVVR